MAEHEIFAIPCSSASWDNEWQCVHPKRRRKSRCLQYFKACGDYDPDIEDLAAEVESRR